MKNNFSGRIFIEHYMCRMESVLHVYTEREIMEIIFIYIIFRYYIHISLNAKIFKMHKVINVIYLSQRKSIFNIHVF